MPLNVKGIGKLGAETLKYLGKNKTIAGALGIGNAKASSKLGRFAQKSARFTTKTGLIGGTLGAAGSFLPDGGPDENDMAERAYNQLRYGADMTDAQMEEAIGKGQQFQDTGIIGENGLNEEQVRAYIAQESRDKLGEQNWYSSAAKKGLGAVEWLGGLVGGSVATGTNAYFDKQLGGARNQELQNIVTKLKQDHNERKIRADREGTMGKAMTEGLLGSEFGSGRVTGIGGRGGIKPPANPQEAEALRQYNKIKAEKGVGYAIKSEYAKLAGRQVYEDINDLIPSEGVDPASRRSAMENLLQQAGIMDADTYMKNATGKTLTEMNAAQAEVDKTAAAQAAEAAAKQTAEEAAASPAVKAQERSGQIDIAPAKTADEVRANQATIATQKGYHGQSPVSVEQTAYLNAQGMKSSRQLDESMNEGPWKALFARHQKQSWDNQQAARNYIAPEHRMGVDPNREAQMQAQAERLFGGPNPRGADGKPLNPVAPAPAPATAPLPAQVNAAATAPGTTPEQKYGPQALEEAKKNGTYLSTNPNAMKPTPYGVGTATPGFPQLPDIGAPVRNAVENALTQRSSRPANVMAPTPYGLGTATPGVPQAPDIGAPVRGAVDRALTQQSSRPSNVMAPTPYGLGTATPGVPQAPDIGAPVRNAVQGALTQQSSPPGVAPKKPMDPAEIAKLIAEQERQKVEARNKANPQRSPMSRPNPMGRFIR